MSNLAILIERTVRKSSGVDVAAETFFEIRDKSSAEILEWAVVNLPPRVQSDLLSKLGMDPSVASILRRAFDAARQATI